MTQVIVWERWQNKKSYIYGLNSKWIKKNHKIYTLLNINCISDQELIVMDHAMKECEVANFYGQASDAYVYVWMVQGSLYKLYKWPGEWFGFR
jgi:hypothetical protein